MSDDDPRKVKLTKFKRMSSISDLDQVVEDSGANNEDKDDDSVKDKNEEQTDKKVPEQQPSTKDIIAKILEPSAKLVPRAERLRKRSVFSAPDAMKTECHKCNTGNVSSAAAMIRSRRKSWCVESSLKKQFLRNCEIRRTLERSEGLPPLFESRMSAVSAFAGSPSRIMGLIDQRFRRMRMSSKAVTLAVPSENRRIRPSILESSRRRRSEAGLSSMTLSSLKSRRKGELLPFDTGLNKLNLSFSVPNESLDVTDCSVLNTTDKVQKIEDKKFAENARDSPDRNWDKVKTILTFNGRDIFADDTISPSSSKRGSDNNQVRTEPAFTYNAIFELFYF